MSDYPDLINYGYQVEAELGRNRAGGRITWKAMRCDPGGYMRASPLSQKQLHHEAIAMATEIEVVIKQFCFAQANSSWSGYKAYDREIRMLQKLSHPGIPQYLDSIETDDGFCLVQEYIAATPCSDFRELSAAEVKQVAQKTLDILIYLQQQSPPILHGDLSTDNILLSETLDVYLIDFGFASLEEGSVSASSTFRGTPGFIAPEQIIKPTMASDIYSLGVVLVCLLTHQDIAEVQTFTTVDDPYQLNLARLLPDLDREFYAWLAKMVEVKVSQRFPDALSAQRGLKELDTSLAWLESEDLETVSATDRLELSSSIKPKIIGAIAITSVTTIATWGINFAVSQVELTITKIAIAILATVAIAVTQLGAATIATSDSQAKVQGIVLSTTIPILLVAASGLIWGRGEAVIISAAIAIAEVALLSYYWGQLPAKNSNKLIKGSFWLSAIAIGVIFGLELIN